MTCLDKELHKYGLRLDRFDRVDLKKCYMQSRPNNKFMDDVLGHIKDPERSLMLNSPHLELALLYFRNGKKWMIDHYDHTRYRTMQMKYKKKNKFPFGFLKLCTSIKSGYLRKGFDSNFIVLLDEPFAKSRFNRDVPNLSPEVWSGHHRVGAVLALNKISGLDSRVKVAVAADRKPGLLRSAGKIHNLCVE